METEILRRPERSKIFPSGNYNHRLFWEQLISRGEPICLDMFELLASLSDGVQRSPVDFWTASVDTMNLCKCVIVIIFDPSEWPNQRCFLEIGMAIGQGIPIFVFCPFIEEFKDRMTMALGSWVLHPEVLVSDHLETVLNACRDLQILRLSS